MCNTLESLQNGEPVLTLCGLFQFNLRFYSAIRNIHQLVNAFARKRVFPLTAPIKLRTIFNSRTSLGHLRRKVTRSRHGGATLGHIYRAERYHSLCTSTSTANDTENIVEDTAECITMIGSIRDIARTSSPFSINSLESESINV